MFEEGSSTNKGKEETEFGEMDEKSALGRCSLLQALELDLIGNNPRRLHCCLGVVITWALHPGYRWRYPRLRQHDNISGSLEEMETSCTSGILLFFHETPSNEMGGSERHGVHVLTI
ncbi:hypothetical protein RRG08_056834 [Elysia crispata]|uniref:Uncharacterized protein n=1 Tax=Elysia crispata TaxID=231223 RepID=A0AAE1ABI6_9GAST|nr:hypothetical protein RRG08_056834 [Elysia crispata]